MLRSAIFLSWILGASAWADVSIEGTHSDGMGGGLNRHVVYLRDEQMRIDRLASLQQDPADTDSAASSLLIRFSGDPAGVMYLDHGSKAAEVLASLPGTGAASPSADPAPTVVNRGETREILGHQTQRYDFSFSGNVDPLALLGQQLPPGMASLVSIRLWVSGTSWVAPGMDGADELADFFAQLTGRQLAIGMPGGISPAPGQALSVVSPGLSRALTGAMAQISRQGLPLLTQTRSVMKADMEGALADMIQGLLDATGMGGTQSTESRVTSVHTTKLPPELFYNNRLPAGYTLTLSP